MIDPPPLPQDYLYDSVGPLGWRPGDTILQHRDVLLHTARMLLEVDKPPTPAITAFSDGGWVGYRVGSDWCEAGCWARSEGADELLLCADSDVGPVSEVRPRENPLSVSAISVVRFNGVQILDAWLQPYGRGDDGVLWFGPVRSVTFVRSGPAAIMAACLRGDRDSAGRSDVVRPS